MLQEEVEVTVLFSDIRGSRRSPKSYPPGSVAVVLARHLAAMAEVVVAHGGTIDKFAGRRRHGGVRRARARCPTTPNAPSGARWPCRLARPS